MLRFLVLLVTVEYLCAAYKYQDDKYMPKELNDVGDRFDEERTPLENDRDKMKDKIIKKLNKEDYGTMLNSEAVMMVVEKKPDEDDDCTTNKPPTERYIEILRGRDGRDGTQGPRGPQGQTGPPGPPGPPGPTTTTSSGAVYVRWGRATCPSTADTQTLYQGVVVGGTSINKGGGADYVCLSNNGQYHSTITSSLGASYLYGVRKYGTTSRSVAPCSVCHTPGRIAELMIPGQISCPSNWTMEYDGYLMSETRYSSRTAMYKCIDKEAESTYVRSATSVRGLFAYTVATDSGIPCPPYRSTTPIACVVCTK